MKTIIKIFLIIGILSSFFVLDANAGAVDLSVIKNSGITDVTINKEGGTDIVKNVEDTGFSILKNIKIVLEGILLIYIVYAGATMVMSMGSDDAALTKAKTQLRYSLVAIVFINVPGTIFDAIYKEDSGKDIGKDGSTFTESGNTNILVNLDLFGDGIFANIISVIEVLIFVIGIYVIIMAGIKIMTSRGREEKVTEAKGKFLYSIFALIFVGFIEAWKQFAVVGNLQLLSGESGIFGKMMDIALLFAGPTVIVFLTYAGYIYITANGDEEKVKKSKSIIVNTLIAIVLLLVMVVFLNDLLTIGNKSNLIN